MSEKLIEELKSENLCTHFILPLLKLNKFSFMPSNFVNSYIATSTREKDQLFVEQKYIAVQIINPEYCSRRVQMLDCFHGTYQDKDYYYYVFKMPIKWLDDLDKFLAGKYSEMSHTAKMMIIKWSRLAYHERTENGIVVTDGRLLALDREKPLKDMWERRIEPWEPITGELLSIPDERSFIDLDTLTRITEPGG